MCERVHGDSAGAAQATHVLTDEEADLLEDMAGYRNRMVHFYHEIPGQELYQICSSRLDEVEQLMQGLKRWVREHPELIDETL